MSGGFMRWDCAKAVYLAQHELLKQLTVIETAFDEECLSTPVLRGTMWRPRTQPTRATTVLSPPRNTDAASDRLISWKRNS